jgi:hypothetical protein
MKEQKNKPEKNYTRRQFIQHAALLKIFTFSIPGQAWKGMK